MARYFCVIKYFVINVFSKYQKWQSNRVAFQTRLEITFSWHFRETFFGTFDKLKFVHGETGESTAAVNADSVSAKIKTCRLTSFFKSLNILSQISSVK
jgi:hypothetical protein